jgi:hypothetical protein
MKCGNLRDRLLKKATQSACRYRIAAIGIDFRGRVIGSATNQPRFHRKGGGLHAEALVIRGSPKSLRTVVIGRIGQAGELRRIEPCARCRAEAAKRGVRIVSIENL